MNIEEAVKEVLDSEEQAVEDYKHGTAEALNYLIGRVMAETDGKVDSRSIEYEIKNSIQRAEND